MSTESHPVSAFPRVVGTVHLSHAAAPSLPAEYVAAIDGLPIGPYAGSCGAAMWEGRRVIVTDIATDPLWEHYREIALRHGLRACWSTPLRSSAGIVIGSFAMYYDEPRAPTARDLSLADVASHLSGLAVQSALATRELRKRAAEQAAIAAIGRRGLAGEDEQSLMDEVVKSVVATVAGSRAALLESDEDGALILRAAAGWPEDVEPSTSRARCIEIPLHPLVARLLEANGLAPERLALELTETILLEDDVDAAGTIAELRALGVRLVLDDFGVGFSSLRYLLQFPIHALKIDRSFVAELPDGRRARAIVAEGIENEAQLAAVRELGCGFAQGYPLGRSCPVEQLSAFW